MEHAAAGYISVIWGYIGMLKVHVLYQGVNLEIYLLHFTLKLHSNKMLHFSDTFPFIYMCIVME